MMRHQPAFAFAVADLLTPIGVDGCAMVVPHERRCRESDLPAACLQAPAHVHIVSRAQIHGVEPADGKQRLALEGHVAAWDVFGGAVVEQDVSGTARRASDALRHRWIVGRHHVRSPRADDVGREERLHEVREPVGVDPCVGVGIRDDFARRMGEPHVPGVAEAAVRDVDHSNGRMLSCDFSRAIARSVVDQNDLEVGIGEPFERRQAIIDRVGCVVRAHNHRDTRPGFLLFAWERRISKCARHGRGNRLRCPLAVDQPERPVLDVESAAPPLVGPGECHRPAGALGERRTNVHRGDGGLPVEPFANAVGAGLGQEQRFVSGDVLQPREIGAQLRLAVQVHVERADVEERQVEKFSRRKVDVREETLGRDGLWPSRIDGAGSVRPWRVHATARRRAESRCRERTSRRQDDRASSPTARTTLRSMSCLRRRSSRKATCCDHGSPTMTRSPWRAASSRRSRRGVV